MSLLHIVIEKYHITRFLYMVVNGTVSSPRRISRLVNSSTHYRLHLVDHNSLFAFVCFVVSYLVNCFSRNILQYFQKHNLFVGNWSCKNERQLDV